MNNTWGIELWDQRDIIEKHTNNGIEFLDKCASFVKERIRIEQDYAKALRRLVKQYQFKKKTEEDLSYTYLSSFKDFLQETDDFAGQHEVIAEESKNKVLNDMHRLSTDSKKERKEALQNLNDLKSHLDQLNKALQVAKGRYDKASEESATAYKNYEQASNSLDMTKAQILKFQKTSQDKKQSMDKAKEDYSAALENFNKTQTLYYDADFPNTVNKELQTPEENRIRKLASYFNEMSNIQKKVLPIVNTCLDGMIKAGGSCDPVKVLTFKNEDDKSKYFNLVNLAMMILLLPHGNADPERGFSINKRLLEKHGANTGEETLESIRIVKDFLIQSGGQNSIKVTPSMIDSCKKSRSLYEKHLEEKRQKEKENAKRKEREDSLTLIDRHKTGEHKPGDVGFEEWGKPGASGNTLAPSPAPVKQLKKQNKSVFGMSSKKKEQLADSNVANDHAELPPAQRRKKFNKTITNLNDQITQQEKAKAGMLKIQDTSKQFGGDNAAIQDQIAASDKEVQRLRSLLHQYECYLSAMDGNPTDGSRSSSRPVSTISTDNNVPPPPVQKQPELVVTESQPHDFGDDFDEARCSVLYDFSGTNEGEMSVSAGEELVVVEDDDGSGWTRVLRGDEEGYIPTSYVQKI